MAKPNYKSNLKPASRKPLFWGTAVLVVILISYGLFSHFYLNSDTGSPAQNTPVTSGPSSANGSKTTNGTGHDQSLATDNQGAAPGSTGTNSSQWTISSSGMITVKQPATNSALKSGDTLYGSAKVSQVQYRVIDNQVGVLAQGPINVVSGNFSATLHFRPVAGTGRLDVFSFDSQGAEVNEVQIPVKF